MGKVVTNNQLSVISYQLPITSNWLLIILCLFIFLPENAKAGIIRKPFDHRGLVGYWSMNEGTGNFAGDASGNNNHGTLTNGPTWVDGKKGKALNFDGVDDYVLMSTQPAMDSFVGITISAWVNTRGKSTDQGIVGKNDDLFSRVYFSLGQNNGNINTPCMTIGNTNWLCAGSALSLNQWQHVVATADTTNFRTIYVDGSQVAQDSIAFDITGSDDDPLVISGWNSGDSRKFNGLIDDVRIYNRALAPSEVEGLYRSGSAKIKAPTNNGLVGYWSMNEGTGNRADDSSGNRNHGTLTNGPVWTNGRLGKALEFDGSNDFVTMPQVINQNTFTISAWIYPLRMGTLAVGNGIFYQGNGAQEVGTLLVVCNENACNTNTLVLRYEGGPLAVSNNNAVTTSRWQHAVAAYNAGTVTFYVDGVAQGSTSGLGTGAPASRNANIGYWFDTADQNRFFQGSIDDVRIYNRALSADEVKNIYLSR